VKRRGACPAQLLSPDFFTMRTHGSPVPAKKKPKEKRAGFSLGFLGPYNGQQRANNDMRLLHRSFYYFGK
jgi:hypothetical protein